MFYSARYLNSSIRSLKPSTSSILSPPRTALESQKYLHLATRSRPEIHIDPPQQKSVLQRTPQFPSTSNVLISEEDYNVAESSHHALEMERLDDEEDAVIANQDYDIREAETQTGAQLEFSEHLNGLFSPLRFPPELARRILTHGSHPSADQGHNAGLSFMGRRVLEAYVHLFLTSSASLQPSHDLELITSNTLNTYILGQYVGSKWGLGRALRWAPTVPANKLKPGKDQTALLKNVGLYKVQGDAVFAVMGGVFHQFGGSVAHRLFHTRLLPNILLRSPDGLPNAFHKDAKAICERMGGRQGNLILDPLSAETRQAAEGFESDRLSSRLT